LYLPQEWIWDKQRRAQARVPQELRFATKPEQAIAMLKHEWRARGADAMGHWR
jgi:SRSO17 transposase